MTHNIPPSRPDINHGETAAEVVIKTGGVELNGSLQLAQAEGGLVIFVHGSGSSRFSPRNRQVAAFLGAHGFGTLLMDLLTPREEERDSVTREWRFDIGLLSRRVAGALEWVIHQQRLQSLPIGLFGASTGAAAALVAAAVHREHVKAVVSRGGRPDLAGEALEAVHAPTLLIVGGNDPEVLELNRQAAIRIPALTRLQVVPGATHLFEEPGALEQVAGHATRWFKRHLTDTDAAAHAGKSGLQS